MTIFRQNNIILHRSLVRFEQKEGCGVSQKSFSFLVYMIHVCSERWGISPASVYKTLKNSGCIGEYLIPNYEILHTQSSSFVLSDIEEYLSIRGAKV